MGGPGAEPPGRRRIFEKFQKISYENCSKCIILAYFSKNLTNHAVIFRAFAGKAQILENFLKEIAKNPLVSYFSKELTSR